MRKLFAAFSGYIQSVSKDPLGLSMRNMTHAAIYFVLASSTARAADEAKDLINLCRVYANLPKTELTTELIRLKSSCGGVLNAHVLVSRPDSG